MEIWEDTVELRIAAAQRRWASEVRKSNPTLADRFAHSRRHQGGDAASGVTPPTQGETGSDY
jgi:hypothetical protein